MTSINPIGILAITVLLSLGFIGWGKFVLLALDIKPKFGHETPVGIQLIIGYCFFSSAGGYFCSLNIANSQVLSLFAVIGVLILFFCLLKEHRLCNVKNFFFNLKNKILIIVVTTISVILSMGDIALQRMNVTDDFPSYLYLAHRLNVTGGLIDSFNARRILSENSFILIQSIYLKFTGFYGIFAAEWCFALGVLALLLFEFRKRMNRSVFVSCLAAISIFVGSGIGGESNLSPQFIVVLLLVSLYLLFGQQFELNHGEVQRASYVLIGLVFSTIFSLRPQYLIGVALLLLLPLGRTLNVRIFLKNMFIVFLTFILSNLGWMLSLYRSNKTFFFQLFGTGGNLGYLKSGITSSFGDFFLTIKYAGTNYNETIAILLIAILVIVFYSFRLSDTYNRRSIIVLLAGLLLTVVVLVVESPGTDPWQIARLSFPIYISIALYFSLLVAPTFQIDSTLLKRFSLINWIYSFIAMILFISVIAAGNTNPFVSRNLGLEHIISGNYSQLKTELQNGINVITYSKVYPDPLNSLTNVFANINSSIRKNSHVLSAVETPSLLDLSKFKVSTLDIPGYASPNNGLKLNESVDSILTYLRKQKIDYILAESSDSTFPGDKYNYNFGLYSMNFYSVWSQSNFGLYRNFANGVVLWQNFVTMLKHSSKYKIQYFSKIALINIDS